MSFLTDHLSGTDKPQTYVEHGRFAMFYSLRLIGAGLIGIIHAICPWCFKFYTAEQIIKSYVEVYQSGRHDDLLDKYGLLGKEPQRWTSQQWWPKS